MDADLYHYSDCAVNGAPALEPGPCDCGLLHRERFAVRCWQEIATNYPDLAAHVVAKMSEP